MTAKKTTKKPVKKTDKQIIAAMNDWKKVVFAADCGIDPETEELFEICPQCGGLYADCECPGPTQDGMEYKEIEGVLYGRKQS